MKISAFTKMFVLGGAAFLALSQGSLAVVEAIEAEVATLAEVVPEGSTEAGCERQAVLAVKRFNGSRNFQVDRGWPAITMVRSFYRLAAASLLFAVPRQIATEGRQIQL